VNQLPNGKIKSLLLTTNIDKKMDEYFKKVNSKFNKGSVNGWKERNALNSKVKKVCSEFSNNNYEPLISLLKQVQILEEDIQPKNKSQSSYKNNF